jgi:hypothetical protein
MANSRVVNTNFWKDSYIIELEPSEKLLFIYFLTNPRTSMAGVYEISLREVAFDTGMDVDFINKTLVKFSIDKRMHYERNWLVLANFIKHQRLNPSIVRGIERAIEELPNWLQEKIELAKDEDKQLSIFITETPQSGDSVSKSKDSLSEYNLNKKKLKKRKEIEPKQTAQAVESSKELSKSQKRSYAISMEKEREQETRAAEAKTRTGSGLQKFQASKARLRRGEV